MFLALVVGTAWIAKFPSWHVFHSDRRADNSDIFVAMSGQDQMLMHLKHARRFAQISQLFHWRTSGKERQEFAGYHSGEGTLRIKPKKMVGQCH